MYRAIKLICSLILLLSVFTLSSTSIKADDTSDLRTRYLKINFNGKVIFHEEVAEGKYIQVLNGNKEIIESIVLKSDTEMDLDSPVVPVGQIFSYWDIKNSDTKFEILPRFVDSNELQASFTSEDNGHLLHNNSNIKELVKAFDEDDLFRDVAPEVNANPNYKFRGWHYYKDTETLEKLEVTDTTKIHHQTNYFALFYQDINNNNIDDTTENITLKFVPNNNQTMNDINLYVGQSFTMPKLDIKKDHVFIGWYTDESFKTKFDNELSLTENTTLYAKWEKAENVIQRSENQPIRDQNISDQVESILNGRLDRLESAIARTNQNATAAQRVQQPVQPTNQNNIAEDNNSNEVLKYTETKYVFNNPNIGERFMVKFFDLDNRFLFSVSLPYGRSIHVLDQSDNLVKEYSVRQDTSITMDVADYVFNPDNFQEFDSRTVRVNTSEITEIYPVLRPLESNISPPITIESEEAKSNVGGLIALTVLFILIIVGIVYYLIKRNKRMNLEIN